MSLMPGIVRASYARMAKYPLEAVLATALFVLIGYVVFLAPSQVHETEIIVPIPSGTSVTKAALLMKKAGVIRSADAFSLLVRVMNPRGGASAGSYSISPGENSFTLAYRLARGLTGVPSIKVTIPEGFTAREIGALLNEKLEDFDAEGFISLAKPHEGYLFPDTYLFVSGTPPEAIINTMLKTFDGRIAALKPEIAKSGHALSDIIIMASLIEKEARLDETRRIVAGILWKRLDQGMALQVDAVFGYIMGTSTFSPSFQELLTDSPYNTYLHTGLPPGPIANPGLSAIGAALDPTETPYLFYLTGSDGTMHYARTHAEHVVNRKFLR